MPRILRLVPVFAGAILAFCASPARVGAQADWESRFPPAAGCTPTIARSAVVDPGDRTGSLVIRTVGFDGLPLQGVGVVVDTIRADSAAAFASPPSGASRRATSDSTARARITGLVPGRYSLIARRIGYLGATTTLAVRAGATDTIALSLETANNGERNVHNCAPRGFRRPGERVCVTESEQVADWLEYGRRLVDEPNLTRAVPRFRKRDVKLVTDEALCERAARAYGGDESPPRRVVVVRLGRSYMVHDPFEPLTAGEWEVTLLFDRKWRQFSGIAG